MKKNRNTWRSKNVLTSTQKISLLHNLRRVYEFVGKVCGVNFVFSRFKRHERFDGPNFVRFCRLKTIFLYFFTFKFVRRFCSPVFGNVDISNRVVHAQKRT